MNEIKIYPKGYSKSGVIATLDADMNVEHLMIAGCVLKLSRLPAFDGIDECG